MYFGYVRPAKKGGKRSVARLPSSFRKIAFARLLLASCGVIRNHVFKEADRLVDIRQLRFEPLVLRL